MRARARTLSGWILPLAILAPGLAWIAADRSVWPWDQAWFGAHTVALYESLRGDPLAWPGALLRATPIKPPVVAWIGQFFVPLGTALGSVDAALRLSVWACQLVALILVYFALMALTGGRARIAAAGTLVAGAAPLAVTLSTQYLAETSQNLAVAWFVLLMSRARDWSRSRLGAQLLAATAFALLAKTTSPLYCTAPGAIALYGVVRRRQGAPVTSFARGDGVRWTAALVLAGACAAWYGRNAAMTLWYARTAAFGPVAELFGQRAGFWSALQAWTVNASDVFFLRPIAALLAALVVVAGVTRLVRPASSRARHVDICAVAAMVQVCAALAAFALSPNRDVRFAAPLLPLLAVVVGWALLQPGLGWAAPVAAAALVLQLSLVQSQVLGLWPERPVRWRALRGIDSAQVVAHPDGGPAADLQAIVERTCGRRGFGADNFVGVELLRLSGHSLTYAAAKERLAGRAGVCHYDTVSYASLEEARALVGATPYVYWITVDPEIRPVPPAYAFLNRNPPILLRQLRRQGVLQPEPWNGPEGVLLFRFVRR